MAFAQAIARIRVAFFVLIRLIYVDPQLLVDQVAKIPQVAQIAPVLLRVSSWTSSGRGSKWAVIAAVASPGSRLRNSASRLTASHIQGAALKINSCHFCPTDDSACMKISVIIASYLVRTGTMELQFWSWDGGFVRVQANFAEQNLLQNQNRISTLKAV